MCSLEFPDLESAFHQAYADDGLVLIGVASGQVAETDALLRSFREVTGVTFPLAWDDGSRSAYAFPESISPYPRQVVVDREGDVVHLASLHRPDVLAGVVEAALGLQPGARESKLQP